MIQNYEENRKMEDKSIQIPLKHDGSYYKLQEANGLQRIILYHVFRTVKNWITRSDSYTPFHRIVSGGGGSGKSYIIHQITSVIRRMFSKTETVETAAYTGSAAYNIGGRTIHSAYAINCSHPDYELSQDQRDKMTRRMRYTVALLFDERSMIPADVLGAVERNVALTCHGGNKHKIKWGGVPVVLLLGDDYQLPPVQHKGKGKGAFSALDYQIGRKTRPLSVETRGIEEFLRISHGAFVIKENQRVQEQQSDFKSLLDRIRIGKPTEQDKNIILSLSFTKLPKSLQKLYEESAETLYLFATKEMCSDHNFKKLKEYNNEENPVAFLKHKLPRHLIENSDQNAIPQVTCFSRGCKVSIKGRNFCPVLGLYNGAIGTVDEIVYRQGHSPNDGDLPLYVAVEFPSYLGHLQEYGQNIWDQNNPKIIPIPMVKTTYGKRKTEIIYCPLVLSFGRTIHTFQGQSAGPTSGKNKSSSIMRIICDVGTTRFETQNIGLFYTALSRATTIGSEENKRIDSAIYFTHSLDKIRLDRLVTKVDGTEYDTVKRRNAWVENMTKNVRPDEMNVDDDQIGEMFGWAMNTSYTTEDIENVIRN